MSLGEQADGKSRRAGGHHQFIKRKKRRSERHKARANPESAPTYNRYRGYET